MDIQFVLTYIIIPVIVGTGIMSGKKNGNHLRLGMMFGFKACVYLYYAVANIVHYINDTWAVRYVVGLTIGLGIIEGLSGFADSIIEFEQKYTGKNG